MEYCCQEMENITKDGYLKGDTLVLPERYHGPYNTCIPSRYKMNYCPFCGKKLQQ